MTFGKNKIHLKWILDITGYLAKLILFLPRFIYSNKKSTIVSSVIFIGLKVLKEIYKSVSFELELKELDKYVIFKGN